MAFCMASGIQDEKCVSVFATGIASISAKSKRAALTLESVLLLASAMSNRIGEMAFIPDKTPCEILFLANDFFAVDVD